MHVAAIKGDQEGIKKLLEQGMSPNVADFAGMFAIYKCQIDSLSPFVLINQHHLECI